MFSSVPQTMPVKSRAWGIGLGTLIMVGVPIVIMSAKTVQITLPLLLVGACWGSLARDQRDRLKPRLDAAMPALAAFILYAGLSGLWAADPWAAVSVSLKAVVVLLGSLLLIELARTEPIEDALHMGEGLWIGLLVGLLYMTAEAASDQAIKIWAYNLVGLGPEMLEPARYFTWENGRLISVHSDDLTRNIVPAPLLLWPALMAASVLTSRLWRTVVVLLLILLSATAVFLASSETAKLALLAGALTFALARYSAPFTRYALSAAWIAACLGVVPAAYLARHLELQNARWLQLSAQLRITIWDEIARKVPDAPWLGVGANMTYDTAPVMHEAPAAVSSWAGESTIAHPHNVYLQTWYELGFVGAALLMLVGLLLLRKAAHFDTSQRPFALALFAAGAVQIAFSYNTWQLWFMCLFGFAAAMFALGQRLLERSTSAGAGRRAAREA